MVQVEGCIVVDYVQSQPVGIYLLINLAHITGDRASEFHNPQILSVCVLMPQP